jgi:spermidine synthase
LTEISSNGHGSRGKIRLVRSRTWLVAALLFGSGFCALVYQVAWLRDFRLIFGASTAASAAVLAIFIGGLGVGGLLLGPRADRHPRPLILYAQLELIVAASAAATPLLLAAVRYIYLASGGSSGLGSTIATIARVVLSAIVLAVPTIAMGGTLPAAARAATRDTDIRRQDVAAVYALNTLGAVLGSIVATFWLLEVIGTRATIWAAAGVNTLIALLAFVIARFTVRHTVRLTASAKATAVKKPDTTYETRNRRDKGRKPPPQHAAPEPAAPAHPAPDTRHPPVWFLLTASATVGFAFFLMELVWYRLLAPLLGGSVFTFGLVLAVALAGIGLGGLVYALVADDKPASLSGLGWTCLIEAAVVAATYALGDRIAFLAATLLSIEITGFGARIAGWTIVTVLVVLPPAFVAGYQFPLLIGLFGRGREGVGAQIGRAYAANTFGAIAGSLAGGFGLLPWLSATGAWQLVTIVLLVLGATAVILSINAGWPEAGAPNTSPRHYVRAQIAGQVLVALLAILWISATGPTAAWRHSGIGAGRVVPGQIFASRNRFREWASLVRRGVVWEGDGTESGVALVQNRTGYAFVVNGKSDGSARDDAGTQVVSGLVGALSHPNPRRAFVIGLGTGSTAGWLGVVPSIDRVDVVEIEPLILDVARACAPVNRDVLNNPKVHITIGDAREMLLTTRDRYDLIASEPSNPYRAGIASLFTQEYYRAAADRLTDDGVFVQWVQAYEIDTPTLAAVFPQVETWHTNPGDLVLVASKQRRTYRAGDFARRVAEEPFKSALSSAWRAIDVHGFLAHFIANDSLARRIANAGNVELNTDDRNIVEFRLARSVGIALATVADIRSAARAAGASRPPLDDGEAVQWPVVDTAWISYNASRGSFQDTKSDGPPNEQARQSALVQYYRNDDLEGARRFWQQQPDNGRDPTEMSMLADITANTGLEGAVPFIDRLREHRPGEADVMLAMLRLTQSKTGDAAVAIESAVGQFRADPWSMSRYINHAVEIAGVLARRDPSLARRMFAALEQPFAVLAGEESRLIARAEITRHIDFPGLCGPAVGALEPHVPWTDSFLRLRRDCYQAAGHPLLPVAERDWNDFLGNSSQPLVDP